ncbi:MAG TPA: transcriptional regulator ArgR [Pseudogracilibacillus sp.]|nr:transcriptional regulator ArgR [Pseudogracilibacillus sp.]
MSKLKRHLKIREIIQNNEIETQDELVNRLRDLDFNVTQATVSRDIKELHLVKVPAANDRYKYSTPNEQRTNPRHKLKRLIMEAFVSIDYANHFIVLKTLPGNAHAIGVLVDDLDWEGILGTICGDDTCLIICRKEEDAETVSDRFLDML